MEHLSVTDAGLHFEALVDHVSRDQVPVALQRADEVVAILTPVQKRLMASDLNEFFKSLPPLGEDAEQFLKDIEAVRSALPREVDRWDS